MLEHGFHPAHIRELTMMEFRRTYLVCLRKEADRKAEEIENTQIGVWGTKSASKIVRKLKNFVKRRA